jgi:hypothetical protein
MEKPGRAHDLGDVVADADLAAELLPLVVGVLILALVVLAVVL